MRYLNGTFFTRTDQDDKTRFYLDGLEVYDNQPESYPFSEGRLVFRSGQVHFQYRIADHLGNTVVLFEDKNDDGLLVDLPTDSANTEVLQRKLYYPFGMALRGTSPARPAVRQGYLYNGKEEVAGTGLYAYGFRYYDPIIGRFTGVDPIADQFASLSVYNFASNDPIANIDLHGLQPYSMREGDANRVANDVNAIYYAKYGKESSKTAVQVEKRTTSAPNPEYGWWDAYGLGGDSKYIEETRYYLTANESFDWQNDRYTKAHKGILDSTVPSEIELVRDRRRMPEKEYLKGDEFAEPGWFDVKNDRQWTMIWDIGGGSVGNFPVVRLSDKLLDTKIGNKPSNVSYTIGGVYLHEYLYHVSRIGELENNRPQEMRKYYNLSTNNHGYSEDHPAGGRTRKMEN